MVPNIVGILSNIFLIVIALKYQSWPIMQKMLKQDEKSKICSHDVVSALDEQLPMWSSQKENSGSSGGTF